MARVAMVMAFALMVGGCAADEKRTVRESTIAQQFAQLNKGGWSVTSAQDAEKRAAQPKQTMKIVKDADFSGLMFRTNFQVDDPKVKEQEEKRRKEEAAKGSPAENTPFINLPPGWK